MADLQGKYQKLAAEYSKLRAQLPVLKKAVLDEQAKKEELRDEMKERDQMIRKFEQETDSLTFRNQQLASRVSVLQQELEENEGRIKKSKHRNSTPELAPSPPGINVIGEELTSKIEENARLHKQVYETNIEHEQVVNSLRDRLMVLEAEASQHAGVVGGLTQQTREKTDRLQGEKAMLEVRLQRQEKDCKDAITRAQSAEEELKLLERDLRSELEEAKVTIRDKLPFNDTRIRELNSLNVPTHDRRHQQLARDLVGTAAGLIKELEQALSNYHTYSEQRTQAFPADADQCPLSDTNKRLCAHLHDNTAHLRPIEQAFRTFHESLRDDSLTTLETAVGLQDFAAKFHKYVTYANKLLPYQLLSLEEESSISSCTKTLELKNMELHAALKKFAATLTKTDTYTALLALQSTANCDQPKSNYPKLFLLLSQGVSDFHNAVKELSRVYNAKVSLEHQLPTASQKLKTTDECIVSSLLNLSTCLGKLSTFLNANLEFCYEKAGFQTRGSSFGANNVNLARSNPAVGGFKQRAANYMASLTRARPKSVPYGVALLDRTTLLSSTESRESLSQQVDAFHSRVSHLEQDKEHWMLEAQLLQMKLEKEKMRCTDLEHQVAQTPGGASPVAATSPRIDNNKQRTNSMSCSTDTSMLGSLETTVVAETDGDLREQIIKDHFSQRIAELTMQLQTADSKALHFHAECRALHKRLSMSDREKASFQDQLASASQEGAHLKDELQTTKRNYEDQLSMMSEHLAGMNEKLTTQKDEIDMLKYQLQNPKSGGKKRGK